MNSQEVEEMLGEIEVEHAADRDGGYALAFAIRDLYRSLEPSGQPLLLRMLVSGILEKAPIWGVAIESIIQIGEVERSDELLAAVRSGAHDVEWRDDVTFALLSLRCPAPSNFYEDYVRAAIAEERPHAAPLASVLAKVDPAASSSLLSKWFVLAHSKSLSVEGYIATVVRNYLAVDEDLLVNLIRVMRGQSAEGARWFAESLNNYLGKPWMVTELGGSRSELLRASIRSALVVN